MNRLAGEWVCSRSLNGPIVGIGAAREAIAYQGVGALIAREDAIEVGAS
jgi:hypothetical protein